MTTDIHPDLRQDLLEFQRRATEIEALKAAVPSNILDMDLSYVLVIAIVQKYCRDACKIPPENRPMIVEIVSAHMKSLSIALGNLELCYLRTRDTIAQQKETT